MHKTADQDWMSFLPFAILNSNTKGHLLITKTQSQLQIVN